MRHYAGVGSRTTPGPVLGVMVEMGRRLAGDWVLRSGGALGADQAFMQGCRMGKGLMEVWNPRTGMVDEAPWAVELAGQVSAVPLSRMRPFVRNLLVRNMYVLLGRGGDSPVSWVCCWSPGAEAVGGTGHTIRAAQLAGIPVWNLADPAVLERFRVRLRALGAVV